jgi:aspartate/methionine/tyrosine aminotransferase
MVDGFSKTYCMTGWRLGYAICPQPLQERLHLLMTHAVGCTAMFTQSAGVAALRGPQDDVAKMIEEYKKRRDYVVDRLNAMEGVQCERPAGAFYVFPSIEGTGKTSQAVADHLLNEAGVATLPGPDFGACGEGHIRLSYVRDMATLKEGLDRMESGLKTMQ